MRNLLFVACLLSGCGSGSKEPGAADLAQAVVLDLAHVDEPDLAVVLPIADMAFSPCTAPMPGIYSETIYYNYVSGAGGVAQSAGGSAILVVRNDGSFERPVMPLVSPTQFHCGFTSIDPLTCLANCCPGQPSTPVMYFDRAGWTLWVGGTCQFTTTPGSSYIATITDVEGFLNR